MIGFQATKNQFAFAGMSALAMVLLIPKLSGAANSVSTSTISTVSVSPFLDTVAGASGFTNTSLDGSTQNPGTGSSSATSDKSNFKLHIQGRCTVVGNTTVRNLVTAKATVLLSIRLPGLPAVGSEVPFWMALSGAFFTNGGVQSGPAPDIYKYIGSIPYPTPFPLPPSTSWSTYPYSSSGNVIASTDYKGNNLFIKIPGYSPISIDASGNMNLGNAESFLKDLKISAYLVLGGGTKVGPTRGRPATTVVGSQNGPIETLVSSTPRVTGGRGGNQVNLFVNLPGIIGECSGRF